MFMKEHVTHQINIVQKTITYEKHIFRQIKEQKGETSGKVCDEIKRASKEEDLIRDQVVDQCKSSYSRRKFLETKNLNLETVCEIA